jgi:UDPglucose--hexose-1-phosphate uridylyltransferase
MNDNWLNTHSHRRFNALSGEWVLVSPQRTQRPWQGANEGAASLKRPGYDPDCYLCAGNARANGERNPDYRGVFVFRNDFTALSDDATNITGLDQPLFQADPVTGECRVICYSPQHDASLGELPTPVIEQVVRTWQAQWCELSARPDIAAVTLFENRGEMMGASNPHPHGQLWASSIIPDEQQREATQQAAYYQTHQRALLLDYAHEELQRNERVVLKQDQWLALVPYWAVWPFELLVLPLRAVSGFDQLCEADFSSLSVLLKQIITGYDRVFNTPFPYSMGWHARPCDSNAHPEWQLHAHFYPPLLRSATVRKYQVGFEMLGMPQRDITPEAAATQLREAFIS